MNRKILAFSGILTSITASASAQISGGSGEVTSVFAIISEVLGINVQDPYNAIAVLATLGVMSLSTYIVLKVGAKKLDIQDSVLPGGGTHSSGGGRNLLALMSVAITLTIFGTGAAAGLIQGFQSIFLLGFVFMILGGLTFVIIGGAGGIFGGGSYVTGKTMKATAEGIKEGSEALDKADTLLRGAEEEAQDGAESGDSDEEEESVERIEEAERLLNQVLSRCANDLERDEQILRDAINEVKETIGYAEDEEEKLGHIDQRFERAAMFMEKAAQEASDTADAGGNILVDDLLNGKNDFHLDGEIEPGLEIGMGTGIEGMYHEDTTTAGRLYGLLDVREDLEKVADSLNLVRNEIGTEEAEMSDEFEELYNATENALGFHRLLKQVQELLDEAQNDEELLEQLAENQHFKRLYEEADEAEDMHDKLQNRKNKIENEVMPNLMNEIENAVDLLEKHLSVTDEEIQYITDVLEDDERDLEQAVQDIRGAVPAVVSDTTVLDFIDEINGLITNIETQVEDIEENEEMEDQKERQLIQEIEEYMSEA